MLWIIMSIVASTLAVPVQDEELAVFNNEAESEEVVVLEEIVFDDSVEDEE
jgi:hypothetical protein